MFNQSLPLTEKAFTIKLWLLAALLLATGLITATGTYTIVHLTQPQPKAISCPSCPVCLQQAAPATTPPKHNRWNFKPLQRDGKSY